MSWRISWLMGWNGLINSFIAFSGAMNDACTTRSPLFWEKSDDQGYHHPDGTCPAGRTWVEQRGNKKDNPLQPSPRETSHDRT